MFRKVHYNYILLFVLVIGSFFTILSNNLYSKPIISFGNIDSTFTHNFGNVSPDVLLLHHNATIYNNGDDTLKILQIKPGCSCVNASINSHAIPPKDSAIIYLTLNTRGYSGHVSKSIDFITDIPNSPVFNIFLAANIVYPITINPKYLIFPKCEVGKAQTQSISILNTSDSTISILSSEASDSTISFSLPPQALKPNQSITFDVTYTPAKDILHRGGILINFDDAKYKTARIYITGMPKKL